MMTGRLWMTSLGHTNETWESEVHREHVREGIKWALEGGNKWVLLSPVLREAEARRWDADPKIRVVAPS